MTSLKATLIRRSPPDLWPQMVSMEVSGPESYEILVVWSDLTTVIEQKAESCAQFSTLAINFIPNSLEYPQI